MTDTDLQQQLRQEQQARRHAEWLVEEKSRALQQVTKQVDQLNRQLNELSQKLAAELAQAREQALESHRATQTFLANMSHELRTPLNAIIGYSDILGEEARGLGREDFMLDLQLIKSAGKQLQAVISDILALTKIETGQMDLDLTTFDIAKMLQEVLTTVQLTVSKSGNTLTNNCDDTIGVMRADMVKVQQILFNLLSNAAKFTQQGQITLTVERRPTETNNPAAGEIIFRVTDTGIGISPEQTQLLFKAFTQVDGSTTRKYGGVGLGLTICHHFCRMMGGQITVESEFGRWSTFTVSLPAHVTGAALDQRPL
jgi:signal transduction histidine kinase